MSSQPRASRGGRRGGGGGRRMTRTLGLRLALRPRRLHPRPPPPAFATRPCALGVGAPPLGRLRTRASADSASADSACGSRRRARRSRRVGVRAHWWRLPRACRARVSGERRPYFWVAWGWSPPSLHGDLPGDRMEICRRGVGATGACRMHRPHAQMHAGYGGEDVQRAVPPRQRSARARRADHWPAGRHALCRARQGGMHCVEHVGWQRDPLRRHEGGGVWTGWCVLDSTP